MFDDVGVEFREGFRDAVPDDDLDGVLERLLAEADTLPEWVPDWSPGEWALWPPDEPVPDRRCGEQEQGGEQGAGGEPPLGYGSCVPSGWLALDLDSATADPAGLSDHALIEAIVGFDRVASWAAARQARLLAELARRRPTDQAPYSARWAGVGSEYAPDEVGVALHPARGTACARVGLACRLLATLPETHALWEAGQIDTAKARAIDDATWMLTPELARAVQDRLLPRAPEQTLAQLKAALARAVIAADPNGAEQRHRQARRDRRVVITPEADGMASLWALLTATQAAGAFTWLTRLARGLGSDDPRSMDTRRADILAALLSGRLLRDTEAAPGEGEADGRGAGPGDGQATGGSPDRTGGVTDSDGDSGDLADSTRSAPGPGRPIQPVTPGKPLIQVVIPYSTLIGTDDHPAELVGHGPIPASLAREVAADGVWYRLVTDPLSGTLLDHGRTTYHPPAGTGAVRLRISAITSPCAGGRRRTAPSNHVRARDVHCRFPGCRRRAADAELDHVVAWSDGGTTSEPNLAACCTHHHRVKTYAGWQVHAHPDGRLTWTTPTGHRHTTRVHDYRPAPPGSPPSPPPAPARDDSGLDPPPF